MLWIFSLLFFSDHLQGGEGMIHPKTIPYNQTRDHSTGGSHHSSDRGSNSTSGEAESCALTDVWWFLTNQARSLCLPLGFPLISQAVKIKGGDHGPQRHQNIMQRAGEKLCLLPMLMPGTVMNIAYPWKRGRHTQIAYMHTAQKNTGSLSQ